MIITYAIYLLLTVAITVWVGQTLFRNGRIFLVDAFHGNEAMAESVNTLLLVGFYLVNIGFVALFLRFFPRPEDATGAFEYIATKVGIVLMVLGGMHYFNMFNFAKMRKKAKRHDQAVGKPEAEGRGW